MMSLTFGLFTQVSDSGPQGLLVSLMRKNDVTPSNVMKMKIGVNKNINDVQLVCSVVCQAINHCNFPLPL